MRILKNAVLILLVLTSAFCFIGCDKRGERGASLSLDDFVVDNVYIEDYTGGRRYRYLVEDPDEAKAIFDKCTDLEFYEDPEAVVGASYILFRFQNKEVTKKVYFTIYENGTCCISDDYKTLYTIEKGRSAYIDLATMYEECASLIAAEDYKE